MKLALCIAAVLAAIISPPALPQGVRPVRLVVPLAPGGTNDTLARIVADKLGERIGQAVVVDNRPGANAQIGSTIVARANPDGNTLLMIGGGHAMNPSLIRQLPYTEHDFAPVSQVAGGPYVMVIYPGVPAKTPKEFAAWVKTKPDVAYGSSGTGGPPHLAGELFKIAAGVNMLHVPYKGGSAVMPDLISGRISMNITSLSTGGPHMKAGRLRPIGVTTRTRAQELPDVPTFIESGFPDYEVNAWYGMLTTGRTPRPRVDQLGAAMQQVLADAQTREQMLRNGLTPEPSSPAAFAELIRRDTIKWAKVVKAAGIQPE